MKPDTPIAEAVVTAVAEAEGVEPSALERPLTAVVDPDALEALFAPTADGRSRADGRVAFTYCGHRVVVDGAGDVDVDESAGYRAKVDHQA